MYPSTDRCDVREMSVCSSSGVVAWDDPCVVVEDCAFEGGNDAFSSGLFTDIVSVTLMVEDKSTGAH